MREELHSELVKCNPDKDWSFVLSQIGMFSFTGMTPAQCDNMTNKVHACMLACVSVCACVRAVVYVFVLMSGKVPRSHPAAPHRAHAQALTVPAHARLLCRPQHHIYMTRDGRLSLAGLSKAKCAYLAAAIDDSVRNY